MKWIFQAGETFALKSHRGSVRLKCSSEGNALSLSRHNGCIALIRIRADTLRSLRSRSSITVLLNSLLRPLQLTREGDSNFSRPVQAVTGRLPCRVSQRHEEWNSAKKRFLLICRYRFRRYSIVTEVVRQCARKTGRIRRVELVPRPLKKIIRPPKILSLIKSMQTKIHVRMSNRVSCRKLFFKGD